MPSTTPRSISPVPAAVDDWRNRSLCTREEPELFFPVGSGAPAQAQVLEAKAVCRRCEVRDPCLSWALDADIRDGVWGGLDEDERQVVRRRARRSA